VNGIRGLALALLLTLVAQGGAVAKKPESPGNSGKQSAGHQQGAAPKQHQGGSDRGDFDRSHGGYFTDGRLQIIRSYYSDAARSGGCPPGLAKKDNHCRPPGQAKRWRVGAPLPSDLIYYDVPSALLYELGRTPEGQRIVRVGTDLLLISVGSGMVLDAIEDLDDIF
jgi:Ni/Co efflux regulator RcnB